MSVTRENLQTMEIKGQAYPACRVLIKTMAQASDIAPPVASVDEYIKNHIVQGLCVPSQATYQIKKFTSFKDQDQFSLYNTLTQSNKRLYLRALAESYLEKSGQNFHEDCVNELYQGTPSLKEVDNGSETDPLYRLGAKLHEKMRESKSQAYLTNEEVSTALGEALTKKALKVSLNKGFYCGGNTQDKDIEAIYAEWKVCTIDVNRSNFQQNLERELKPSMESKYSQTGERESKIRVDTTVPLKPVFNRNLFFTELNKAKTSPYHKEKTWAELSSNYFKKDAETKTMKESDIKQEPKLAPDAETKTMKESDIKQEPKVAPDAKPKTITYDFSKLKKHVDKAKLEASEKEKWNLISQIKTPLSALTVEALDHKLAWLLQEKELSKRPKP